MRRDDTDSPELTLWNVQRLLSDHEPKPLGALLAGISAVQRRHLRTTLEQLEKAGFIRVEPGPRKGTRYRWIGSPAMEEVPQSAGQLWGDPHSYPAVHHRLRTERGKAKNFACVQCGNPAHDWAYDGLDPDAVTGPAKLGRTKQVRYSLNLDRYRPLCRGCHMRETGVTL